MGVFVQDVSSQLLARVRAHGQPVARPALMVSSLILTDLVALCAAGGLSNCLSAELAFHQEIWDLSGNPWLATALLRVCRPYFTYVSAHNLGRKDMTAELLHEQHAQYVRYLAGDDTRSAAECVRFHLNLGA